MRAIPRTTKGLFNRRIYVSIPVKLLNASQAMLANASIRDSLSWNQEILTMLAMVFIHMGAMIVPYLMVNIADHDDASVLFIH